jgi:hypothetical protein
MAWRQSLWSILDASAFKKQDAPSTIDLPDLWLRSWPVRLEASGTRAHRPAPGHSNSPYARPNQAAPPSLAGAVDPAISTYLIAQTLRRKDP